ncbi:MAG: hypothetical protein CM1200mP2_53560 [Planctomycetaceae bacterium]|nr:MAG: hypothetical protein CM1200mP2_53560 [Planctomycetaceae bacterium]
MADISLPAVASRRILIRLLVNSQFLTELVLKHPDYLRRLTESRRLAEVRSRDEFLTDLRLAACEAESDAIDAIRRTQRWELLRIAACDCFGLMDLRRITLQLSLLADATIQAVLEVATEGVARSVSGSGVPLTVVALGKLGGEELNYSSDIDLLFLSDSPDAGTLKIAQQLVRELGRMTGEGFLYRVDMRLRPWGRSGPWWRTSPPTENTWKRTLPRGKLQSWSRPGSSPGPVGRRPSVG